MQVLVDPYVAVTALMGPALERIPASVRALGEPIDGWTREQMAHAQTPGGAAVLWHEHGTALRAFARTHRLSPRWRGKFYAERMAARKK